MKNVTKQMVLLQPSLARALCSSLEFPLAVQLHNSALVLEGSWQVTARLNRTPIAYIDVIIRPGKGMCRLACILTCNEGFSR